MGVKGVIKVEKPDDRIRRFCWLLHLKNCTEAQSSNEINTVLPDVADTSRMSIHAARSKGEGRRLGTGHFDGKPQYIGLGQMSLTTPPKQPQDPRKGGHALV